MTSEGHRLGLHADTEVSDIVAGNSPSQNWPFWIQTQPLTRKRVDTVCQGTVSLLGTFFKNHERGLGLFYSQGGESRGWKSTSFGVLFPNSKIKEMLC